jgi:hypothetical protein
MLTAFAGVAVAAGLIPFALHEGRVLFLFQRVFEGRKTGFLNDFGGGQGEHEGYAQTAIREFVEETETMFFETDLNQARRTPERIAAQIQIMEQLFERTHSAHPDWWCPRRSSNPAKPKDWRSYFVQVGYRALEPLNQAWKEDQSGRFKKRRELIWVDGETLLSLYASQPERLWKRVRQLEGAERVIRQIMKQVSN